MYWVLEWLWLKCLLERMDLSSDLQISARQSIWWRSNGSIAALKCSWTLGMNNHRSAARLASLGRRTVVSGGSNCCHPAQGTSWLPPPRPCTKKRGQGWTTEAPQGSRTTHRSLTHHSHGCWRANTHVVSPAPHFLTPIRLIFQSSLPNMNCW